MVSYFVHNYLKTKLGCMFNSHSSQLFKVLPECPSQKWNRTDRIAHLVLQLDGSCSSDVSLVVNSGLVAAGDFLH